MIHSSHDRLILDTVSKALPVIKWLTRQSNNASDDADDLFQNTFTHLLDRYRSVGTVPNVAYAEATARTIFCSAARKLTVARKAAHALRGADQSARWNGHAMSRHDETVLDEVAKTAEQTRLWQALDLLPQRDREVIDLSYLQEMKRGTVAATLGLSCRGATSRRVRAIQRLSKLSIACKRTEISIG